MPRTPNTQNDRDIAKLLKSGKSVVQIAEQLGVSDPTVYKAIRRLGLSLPGRLDLAPPPTTAGKPATKKTAATTAAADASTPAPPAKKATAKRAPTKAPNARPTATTSVKSVALVPIAADDSLLLTVRVDKGIELLKNLSARIVRHERELAIARQRYADTLAALALE
ncbi:MAG: hypothetical protein JWM34_1094 [Ilumatobacteraceae bacterium]|nr:hypothetical protein [Ilumatobacteraceae bacterium]